MADRQIFELTFPASPENLILGREVSGALLESWGAEPALIDDVKTALTEACDNAIIHGYSNDRQGNITVCGNGRPGRSLEISVRDQGHGLRLTNDKAGLGMGLPLIAAVADEYVISGGPDGGTEVRMCFGLDSSPARLSRAPSDRRPADQQDGLAVLTTEEEILIKRFVIAVGSNADLDIDRLSDLELTIELALGGVMRDKPVETSVGTDGLRSALTVTLDPVVGDSLDLPAIRRLVREARVDRSNSSERFTATITFS